ncbi:RidA family protein [Bryobacter aggregatus]|uniref:RidA family protein n=1 Tax=Bryobacter aggregatus TaxID=360054 RepID=UPI000689F4CD|nr:RidA family protein [Bryobacter aggregatus]
MAIDYKYVANIECKAYRECMEKLPKGKVVATTVYLADIADYAAMNRVYETYFPALKPARNTVESKLSPGMKMGLNAVLYTGEAELKGLTPPNVTNSVPITPGILTPDKFFIAGILGRDSNTGKVPESPEAQMNLCLSRLGKVLETAQISPSQMLQATVYHTAAMPREVVEEGLARYFGPSPTLAVTIVEVPALALGAQVGLNGVADAKTFPDDVASIDAIVKAVYRSISAQDWDRFRYIMHPTARLRTATVEDYISRNGKTMKQNGFAEDELSRKELRFEGLAHVWSEFGIRMGSNPAYVRKGFNSLQLFFDGTRWWVMNINWDNAH